MIRRPPRSPLFPYAPLSRSDAASPATGIRAVHDAGLLTATVAQRYGGPGAGLADTVAILKALGKGDPSVALISAMTLFTHAMQGVQPDWPHDVYATAVKESGQQPVLINALRVQPELGTPARGGLPATIARRRPDGGWAAPARQTLSAGAEGPPRLAAGPHTTDDDPTVGAIL